MIFFVCFQPLWTKIFSILKWNCFIHSDAGKMIEKAFSSLTALMETISFKFQHCNNSMGQQHGQLWGQGLKYILPYFAHTLMQLLVSIKSISCWVSEMPVQQVLGWGWVQMGNIVWILREYCHGSFVMNTMRRMPSLGKFVTTIQCNWFSNIYNYI